MHDMTFVELIVLLVIAAVCGSIGASLAGSSKKGCVVSMVLGFIGAIIGRYLSKKFDMPMFLVIQGIPVIWAIIGSTIFVAVINFISGGDSKKKDQ